MRISCLLMTLALIARADEKTSKEGVVKAVRALLSASKSKEIDSLRQELFARGDLDWPSVREGLEAGRYYRDPLSTNYGMRHSGKHMHIRLMGKDAKERGFSIYVPKSYKAKQKIPLLVYLHHNSSVREPNQGATLVYTALAKFRKAAEKEGVLVVAPYTSRGAQWWMPEGRRLVEWTLARVKERYNIDEDRIALMGARDGAEGVWFLGQELPGLWSCLMPMSGDHYEITGLVRPLYLGTLDRMDILMGVPGNIRGTLGKKNANQFLAGLKPMIGQSMRITTVIAPRSQGDFSYLPRVLDDVMTWVSTKQRKAMAKEVDLESDAPLRGLWLVSGGVDPKGDVAEEFPTTRLVWTPPAAKEPKPKLGLELHAGPKPEDLGLVIRRAQGAASKEGILPGDILVSVGETAIRTAKDVKQAMEEVTWRDEVRIVVVREVKESELEQTNKRQSYYMKMVAKRRELRAAHKPIPEDLMDRIEAEGDEEGEEDDEGCTTIEIGEDDGDDEKAGKDESETTFMVALERHLFLRRPMADFLVRRDFGADWDRKYKQPGVRVVNVYTGGLAARSGFREGDVITAVGSDDVQKARDVRKFFKDFLFEKAPEGERFLEFTVLRGGKAGQEETIRVDWDPPVSARVDGKWKKEEKILEIRVRHAAGFTVYFSGEHIKPGEDFYLYVNDIPYRDLVDPDSTPAYPEINVGTDPFVKEQLYNARRKRAKVKGWTPDLKWAVQNALERRDRRLVFGARRSFDLTSMKAGFEAAEKRRAKRAADRAARVRKAYEESKTKG